MEYFTFGAEQEDVGTRIDVFLADAMENLSRSGVQKLIEEGHITLNGGRTKANYKALYFLVMLCSASCAARD